MLKVNLVRGSCQIFKYSSKPFGELDNWEIAMLGQENVSYQ